MASCTNFRQERDYLTPGIGQLTEPIAKEIDVIIDNASPLHIAEIGTSVQNDIFTHLFSSYSHGAL